MHDELDRLRTNPPLQQLLAHYVRVASQDREVWQDRALMDGIEAPELSKLHGDLLAFGWIEWTSSPKRPTACYRVTNDGVRALRLLGESNADLVPIDLPPIKRKREKPLPAEYAVAE